MLAAWAQGWIGRIGRLYRTHHALLATEPGTSEHEQVLARFRLFFDDLDSLRIAQSEPTVPLHPAAAKVIATFNREWPGLARHRELPFLPLDDNAAERALRGPVIGRKNFYGSGAIRAATLAADTWTVTATAARHDLQPLSLLTDYLQACAAARHPRTSTRSCPGPRPDAAAAPPPNQHQIPNPVPVHPATVEPAALGDRPGPLPHAHTTEPRSQQLHRILTIHGSIKWKWN